MPDKVLWFFIFLILYASYCIFWGIRGSKNSNSPNAYYLANRNVSSWVFFFAATAATFAGLISLSQTGLIFLDGFQYVGTSFIAITIPLGSIIFFKRQWMLSRKYGYITPGEMYYDYYRSDALRIISVIVTFFVAVPLLAILFGSTGFLVNLLTEGNISRELSMWIISSVVLLYVVTGGFKATVSIGVVQSWLFVISIFVLGIIVYVFVGGFDSFNIALSKIASTTISTWGSTNGYGGGEYNSYFAIPGVIQWVAGLGKEPAVGGPWTAMMILTFTISFMGIILSPSFSMWSFSTRHPKSFSYYQVWGCAAAIGILLFVFVTFQGVGANLLGANAAINNNGLSINNLLPETPSSDHTLVIYHIASLMDKHAIWLTGALILGLIAALQSTAAAFLMTSGSIITRDLYKTYIDKDIKWEKERMVARLSMLLIFLAALYLATFAKPAMILFGGIAISIAFQFSTILLGTLWFPWITRGAATMGVIIGFIVVILTETLGQQITGNRLPWGRWPLTIHSGVWGLLFNVFVCFSISAFSSFSQNDVYRSHRQKFHDFLSEHMGLHPSRRKIKSFAYVLVLIWIFFGIGPGLVLGNDIFGNPGGGYEAWVLKIPSIWGYQLIWWFLGVGLVWFLANKMDLSTLPKKAIRPNDLYVDTDFPPAKTSEGAINYTENLGSGYGWILVLVGLAILSIVFYIYVV